jgi:hypothetical protein
MSGVLQCVDLQLLFMDEKHENFFVPKLLHHQSAAGTQVFHWTTISGMG